MPIRPENKLRYPTDWKTEVVPRIRARSGNRCECTGECGVQHEPGWWNASLGRDDRCGIANGDISYMVEGRWQSCLVSDRGEEMERRGGKVYKAAKIVLTVGHLQDPIEDCSDENLRHWCQGCHNRYDAPARREGIKQRARAVRAARDLFACEEVVT